MFLYFTYLFYMSKYYVHFIKIYTNREAIYFWNHGSLSMYPRPTIVKVYFTENLSHLQLCKRPRL